MNSTINGFLYILFGILFLLWFGYEVSAYLSQRGPTEDNAVISLSLTALKLFAAVSLFVSGIRSLRKKD